MRVPGIIGRGSGLALLAALLALGAGPSPAQEVEEPAIPPDPVTAGESPPVEELTLLSVDAGDVDRIQVDADRFQASEDADGARIVTAHGNVRVTVTRRTEPDGPVETAIVLADTVKANLDARLLRAEGNVAVSSEGRTATGRALEYRWQDGAGRVEGVHFREYGISFRAETMDLQPLRLVVSDAAFSTCGLDDPDFEILAKRITIIPNKRIEARGVSVEVFQKRLIRLPRLVYRIERGRARARQALPVGRPGYSRVSGFSLAQPIPIGRDLDAEIEPTTRAGVRGRVLYRREGRTFSPFAEASWKQEVGVRDHRAVLVSRLPEVGLRFGPNGAGAISVGSFREHGTGTNKGRLSLSYKHTILDRGLRPGIVVRAGGLASAYTNGDQYGAVYGEVAVGRGGEDTFTEVGLRVNGIGGKSPFLWDRIQVRSEVFGARRIALGDYRLEGAARYDLDRNNFYDVQVAVARRYSCLEPEIRFSTQNRSFSLGLRVFGIGSTEDDGPRRGGPEK